MKHHTDEEIDGLLVELRESLSDVIESNKKFDNYYYLFRWLVHNNMRVEQTAKLIRESIKWRKETNVDELVERDWAFWDPGVENIIKIHFGGISKLGQPVATAIGESVDFRSILQKHSGPSFLRFIIQYVAKLEDYMLNFYKHGPPMVKPINQAGISQSNSNSGDKSVLQTGFNQSWISAGPFHVASYRNFPLWNTTCLEAIQVVMEAAKIGMKYFPALASGIHFINLNKFSKIILNIIKPLIKSDVYNIDFYDTEKSKWSKLISEKVDADQLEPFFGGTKVIGKS